MDANESPTVFDHVIYLESNVWPILATSPTAATLVDALKRKHKIVASTIVAAELLRAPLEKRSRLAKPFCNLVTLPLLEPPLMLAEAAAKAFVHHKTDYELRPTDQSRTIYAVLCGLTDDPNVKGVAEWVASMHDDVDKFITEIRPSRADPQSYTRSEIIQRDDFLDLLTAFPVARSLHLTRQDMRMLLEASDIWMALAGALAHTITLATTHTPKRHRKKQRTGGPDIWQLVYLGVAEVFVTNDKALLKAATDVSRLLKHPRCVVNPGDFLGGVIADTEAVTCAVCGSMLPTETGSHYNESVTAD